MISAAAYVLSVPELRREVPLADRHSRFAPQNPVIAEPVPNFDHSRRAPLIVLASFEAGAVTHVADGRRGASAGTGLVRLNIRSLVPLSAPIQFTELINRAPRSVRHHLDRILNSGGKLPPKSLGAVVNALIDIDPSLSERLTRFSERRAELIARLSNQEQENLALQKEALATALEIGGFNAEEVLSWSPTPSTPQSFLDGLPEAYVREDAAIISDFTALPGFEAVRSFNFAAKVFQRTDSPAVRLTVIMANRLPLEQQSLASSRQDSAKSCPTGYSIDLPPGPTRN